MKQGRLIMIAAIFALLAVAIGAFGAHGASNEKAKAWIETGAQQHMAHSLALFVVAFVIAQGVKHARWSAYLFVAGITLFSGSLYALALGAPKITAMAAPLGGLCFMAGWAVLAWAGFKIDRGQHD